MNHLDCILFVSNDTEFGQKLKQRVALHDKGPLKQSQNNTQTHGTNIQNVIFYSIKGLKMLW